MQALQFHPYFFRFICSLQFFILFFFVENVPLIATSAEVNSDIVEVLLLVVPIKLVYIAFTIPPVNINFPKKHQGKQNWACQAILAYFCGSIILKKMVLLYDLLK